MSIEIPAFTTLISPSTLPQGTLTYDQALLLVSGDHWIATSRNSWFQSLLRELIGAYGGFEQLRYLTEVVSVVPVGSLQQSIEAIQRLTTTVSNNPQVFAEKTTWYGATVDDIRRNIDEAIASRNIDDDSKYAFSNFFSFLASQIAALEAAKQQGKCILYVQAQP